MSKTFEKKFSNDKYPDIKLYSNMILTEKQLNGFIQENKKIKLENNDKDEIELNEKLKNNLNLKINNNIFSINNTFENTIKYIYYNTLTGIYCKILNNKLKIPMENNKRSLNLASSVAIILAECLKQTKWI